MATWPRGNTRVEDTGIIDPNKRQKDEDEDGRQELEKMLEQKVNKFIDETEQQRDKLET